MGAGRIVMGLAAVAAMAVIWKKNQESIRMWILDQKKEVTAISHEMVLKDQNKKKIKDQKMKRVKVSQSTMKETKEMLDKKGEKKALQQPVMHAGQSNPIHPIPSHLKDWRHMHSALKRVLGRNWSSEFVGEMPSDLWPDILSRLPVKSLARFRCVCKQWRSLTYDAAFQGLYWERALERKPHTIFVPECVPALGRSDGLQVYELGPGGGQIREIFPPLALKYERISNPVNGLVVAYFQRGSDPYYYLLNPATREHSPIPASQRELGSMGCHVGFGFDASSGKYKLVRLLRRDGTHYCSCEILTVGSQEWRFIGETPCPVIIGRSVFLNGAIYWMSLSYELHSISVLAFDIKDEKFQRISSFGPSSRGVFLPHFSLHQFGGQIFLAQSPFLPFQHFLRIWLLRDDGESHTWKEECNVDMSGHFKQIGRKRIHLLDIKDGKLMMQQSPSIYSYGLLSKTLQEIYPLSGFYEVGFLYSMVESFISPRSLTDTSTLYGESCGHSSKRL